MSGSRFDPRAFFTLAQSLGTPGHGEEHLRSAVSRAYYACFHVARLALERGGRWRAGTINAHNSVIAELRRRNRSHLAQRLFSLKQWRELADYELNQPLTEQFCAQALATAAELLRLLDRP